MISNMLVFNDVCMKTKNRKTFKHLFFEKN